MVAKVNQFTGWILSTTVQFALAFLALTICLIAYISFQSIPVVILVTVVGGTLLYAIDSYQLAGTDCRDEYDGQQSGFSYHDLALTIYTLLGAIILSGIRGIRGLSSIDPYSDWALSEIPEFWFSSSYENVFIYNKAHIRQGIIELILLFIALWTLLFIFTRIFRRLLSHKISFELHPATAILAFATLIAVVRFPPYSIDLFHWTVWIGPSLGTMSGEWPILHVSSGYGFLSAGMIAIVLKLFSMSPFVLYVLVASFALLAALILYFLIIQISGSKVISALMVIILMYGFYDPVYSLQFPNSGPLRFQLMICLTMLLAWFILSENKTKAFFASTVFGIMILWDPIFQAFAAIAISGILIYQTIFLRKMIALYKLTTVVMSSLIVLIIVFLSSNGFPSDGISGIIHRTTGFGRIFYEGFAGLPQNLIFPEIVWLGSISIGVALLIRKVIDRQILTTLNLMLALTIVYAVPLLLYNLGRTAPQSHDALAWIFLPMTILVVRSIWQESSQITFYIVTVSLAVLLILSQNMVQEVKQRGDDLFFGYEIKRAEWSIQCASKVRSGEYCEDEWPDPYQDLRNSAQVTLINMNSYSTRILINLCNQGIPLLSSVDSYIYLYGNCSATFTFSQPSSSFAYNQGFDKYIEHLVSNPIVAIDWQMPDSNHQRPFFDAVAKQLNNSGYCTETINGGDVAVYHRACDSSIDDTLVRITLPSNLALEPELYDIYENYQPPFDLAGRSVYFVDIKISKTISDIRKQIQNMQPKDEQLSSFFDMLKLLDHIWMQGEDGISKTVSLHWDDILFSNYPDSIDLDYLIISQAQLNSFSILQREILLKSSELFEQVGIFPTIDGVQYYLYAINNDSRLYSSLLDPNSVQILPDIYDPQSVILVDAPTEFESSLVSHVMLLPEGDRAQVIELINLNEIEMTDLVTQIETYDQIWYLSINETPLENTSKVSDLLLENGYVSATVMPANEHLQSPELELTLFQATVSLDEPILQFGEEDINLWQWSIMNNKSISACEDLWIGTWWTSEQVPNKNYRLTLKLWGQNSTFLSQSDSSIGNGIPMKSWQTDSIYFDLRSLSVPCNLVSDNYDLTVGIYSQINNSFEHLDIRGEAVDFDERQKILSQIKVE